MTANSILGSFYLNLLCFVVAIVLIFFHGHCFPFEEQRRNLYNPFTVSSFSYSKTELKPYDWRYIRVDVPPWFSSMSIALDTDVDLDPESIKKVPTSRLPMICLREGSPPLPDVYNTSLTGFVLDPISNGSFGDVHGLQNAELCYPLLKHTFMVLTNEQIPPGVWYWGLFNGIGPMRTQSKMINRGPVYSFRGNVSVEGCATPMMLGQYCNQTVDPLSCADSYNLTEDLSDTKSYNQTAENVVFCRSSDGSSCHGDNEPKIYSLDVVGVAEQLTITMQNVRSNEITSSIVTGTGSGFTFVCYARHGAIPLANLHDYSTNISENPLVIRSPKIGRWYISVHLVNLANAIGAVEDVNVKVCYSLDWAVLQCPENKAGLKCTWERYMLQTVLRKNPSDPFEAYYLPITEKVLSDSANFPLDALLSNSSYEGDLDVSWTYFLLDIPFGAAGGNLHIRLTSDVKMNYEIYAKYGGLPSLDSWDYYYANTTSSSNGSMFFKLYDSNDEMVSLYILYVRGGTWSFGLRHMHLNPSESSSKNQTTMSISLERCPRKCSSHGLCHSVVDASGLTLYSYCYCDRNHGGFDCSVEIVSHRGHIWQSICLIASNAAAVLPAYWSLHQKAFAEWVLFMSSGISSGLYHACDVGTWCPLPFHVLQFMDFWLSFMAVVSTFIYLADIDEVSKRTIHTIVAIITALMAETGPTRWQVIKGWLHNLIKKLVKRFRWGFLLAALTALAMAAISWTLESSESYWIWHSVWHVSIYTSSFLFLYSKANAVDGDDDGGRPDRNYVLTRQNSLLRGE
ncbi:hypothetical protein U1Q18_023604 [Sarracenia purpurea var. burkii]